MISTLLFAASAILDPAASQAINDSYGRLAQSRAAGDVAGMASHFDATGILIDSRPAPAMLGSALAGQLAPMAERLKKNAISISTQYRLERRTLMGDIAIDAGFMRMKFTRASGETAQPVPQDMTRRFMVTWRRGDDGRWRIVGDASFPATEEQWAALKPQEGLRFD